jgi:hypothetical protein
MRLLDPKFLKVLRIYLIDWLAARSPCLAYRYGIMGIMAARVSDGPHRGMSLAASLALERLTKSAVALFLVLVLADNANAQTQPPAQAQAPAAAAPAQPSDPMLDQADADLRALVASINARLSAINDDMTAMKERAKRQTPAAKPAEAKPAK